MNKQDFPSATVNFELNRKLFHLEDTMPVEDIPEAKVEDFEDDCQD